MALERPKVPVALLPNLHDQRHPRLQVEVNVGVRHPGPGVVQLCPQDDVAIPRYLDDILWQAVLGGIDGEIVTSELFDYEALGDWMTEDSLSYYPEPASVLVDRVSCRVTLTVDQDKLNPVVPGVRELQEMVTGAAM